MINLIYLLPKMLICNILYLYNKKLSNYLKKEFFKLLSLKTFQAILRYLNLILLIR